MPRALLRRMAPTRRSPIRYRSHISHPQVTSNDRRITPTAHQRRTLTHGILIPPIPLPTLLPMDSSSSRRHIRSSRNARRHNVPTAQTVMMTPLRMPPASEARSASLTKCLHRRHLIIPNRLLPNVHGGCLTASQSVATRSRLKRTRKKRMRMSLRDLLQNIRQLS